MDDRTIPIDPSNAPTADASVAPLPHAVAPGDAFGPYRVVRALGAGGFGAVFLATHPILGEVALKILRRGSSESLQRFVREGTLVLDHPAIPRILDQGEVGGVRYLAQSYVAGRSLERVLRDRPMTEAEAIALGSEIAGILAYTHERGVIHCDLKPQNILLDDAGRVHVLDFGIARIRSLADGPDADAGTPGYFAPEQALGQEVGPPTDLHALGIVLYEAATGRLPYEAESPVGQIAALIHGVAVPAGLRRADLSPAFQALLMRLLAKDAAERPQSAAEVGRTLDLLASGVHPAGRFVAIARLRAGSGGVLEIAGGCREDREEVIASLALEADRFGVAVVSGTGEAVAYGALSQALGPLVELPAAPTRQDVLASFRRRLLGRCRERPLALVLRAAHQLDDGTLALVEQMAPSLPSIPLLVVLAGPATDGSVAALCGRLQPTGVLTRIALPGPAGAPDEDDAPDVAPREILARAREARRLWVMRLALALFESYLATGDGEGRQEALTQAATLLRLTRRFSEARARLEELRAAFPHDRVSWGRATLDLAIVEHESGSRDAARSLVLDAIDAASSVPDPVSARLHASCQLLLGTIEARAGRHVEALACTERALTHVMNPGEKHNRVRVLNNRGAILFSLGRLVDARDSMEAALAVATEIGDPEGESTAVMNLATLLPDVGDPVTARTFLERALALKRREGDAWGIAASLTNLASFMASEGEVEAGTALVLEAEARFHHLDDAQGVAAVRALRARLRAEAGDLAGSEAISLGLLDEHRASGNAAEEATTLLCLGAVRHAMGRCDAAQDGLSRAVEIARSTGQRAIEIQALAELGQCRALASDAGGIALCEEAVAMAASSGQNEIHTRLFLARALSAASPGVARDHARAIVEEARRRGFRRLTQDAMRLWERLAAGPSGRDGGTAP